MIQAKRSVLFAVLLFTSSIILYAQNTLITGATLHLGDGEKIEQGYLGIDIEGRIDYVGTSAPLENYNRRINAEGAHVYPGFILPNTSLGLVEIGAVRASRDQAEVGAFNPNVRSLIAFNCESDIIPTAMDNGVLLAQITPRSGWISGTSSIVSLDCWNWEDAVVKQDDAIHLNWPAPVIRKGWWAEPGGIERNKNYDKQLADIQDFLSAAKAFNQGKSGLKDLRYAACA
ncbi:MAG: amidohydrolase, partial [Luteibaculum sp.]